MGLRDRFRRHSEAEEAYWAANDAQGEALLELAVTDDPYQRMKLLRRVARHCIEMARRHGRAFGPDPLEDEDGRDMADSLAWSAQMYGLLVDVEYAVATNRPRHRVSTRLDQAAVEVLDEMAATVDLAARMRLLERFFHVALPFTGPQAAEAIATLPAPGMCGWRTLDEHPHGADIARARQELRAKSANG